MTAPARLLRTFLALLALLALSARAATPAGYMLSADQGRLAVTLCGAGGERALALDLSTGALIEAEDHSPGDDPATADMPPCVFSVGAFALTPPSGDILSLAAAGIDTAPVSTVFLRPGLGLAAPPPWSTGPPLLA